MARGVEPSCRSSWARIASRTPTPESRRRASRATEGFRRKDSNLRKRNQNPSDHVVIGSDDNDSASIADRVVTGGDSPQGALPRRAAATDADEALVRALDAAVAAGRLDVVAVVVEELRARRLAQAGNVVELDPSRARRRT